MNNELQNILIIKMFTAWVITAMHHTALEKCGGNPSHQSSVAAIHRTTAVWLQSIAL